MEHDFIDRYADGRSIVHLLDPRVKILSFFFFIFIVIFTPYGHLPFLLYFSIILSIMILSGVPLPFIFRRSLIVIPFVLFVALISVAQGPIVILTILIKSWLCILSMIVLASTTRFPELLKAFESLRLPRVIVMLMSFMYRYIFVVVDEIMRMKKARDSRSFGGNRRWHIRTAGSMIGALFLRTYERGERIYISMASRGFTGKIKILKDFQISRGDLLFALPFFSSLLAVRLIV